MALESQEIVDNVRSVFLHDIREDTNYFLAGADSYSTAVAVTRRFRWLKKAQYCNNTRYNTRRTTIHRFKNRCII